MISLKKNTRNQQKNHVSLRGVKLQFETSRRFRRGPNVQLLGEKPPGPRASTTISFGNIHSNNVTETGRNSNSQRLPDWTQSRLRLRDGRFLKKLSRNHKPKNSEKVTVYWGPKTLGGKPLGPFPMRKGYLDTPSCVSWLPSLRLHLEKKLPTPKGV